MTTKSHSKKSNKTVLSIETSCDETGLAVLEASGSLKELPKFKIKKALVASQIKVHQPFGGVVPNLAKREHLANLPALFEELNTKGQMDKIDLITVTVGPGLEPALWTGIGFAKELAKKYKKPLIGANHLEGHLMSFLLPSKTSRRPKNIFPAIGLIVSGGHTILLQGKDLKTWKRIGETRDDAAGEAYDKVARLLDLPYPGGPEIEKLARQGDPQAIPFPRPMIHDKNLDFSFSGLKTSVLYHIKNLPKPLSEKTKADIAASFQQAVVDVLIKKTLKAAKEFKAKTVLLSGGVASNGYLRESLRTAVQKEGMSFLVPDLEYNTDNGVMIAAAGYVSYLRKKKYPIRAKGDLEI